MSKKQRIRSRLTSAVDASTRTKVTVSKNLILDNKGYKEKEIVKLESDIERIKHRV